VRRATPVDGRKDAEQAAQAFFDQVSDRPNLLSALPVTVPAAGCSGIVQTICCKQFREREREGFSNLYALISLCYMQAPLIQWH